MKKGVRWAVVIALLLAGMGHPSAQQRPDRKPPGPVSKATGFSAGERRFGYVGEGTYGGWLGIPANGPVCREGIAEVIMHLDLSRSSNEAAPRRSGPAAVGDRAGLDREREKDKARVEARNRVMQNARDLLAESCPDLRVIRFEERYPGELYPGGIAMRSCARAERQWAYEMGSCDARSEAGQASFTRFVISHLMAEEAEVRGWSEVKATSTKDSWSALFNADVNGWLMGASPRPGVPAPPPPLSPQASSPERVGERLIADRKYREAAALIEARLSATSRNGLPPDQRGMELVRLAAAYEGAGRPTDAITTLQQAIGLAVYDKPGTPFLKAAIMRLGIVYERGGEFDAADAAYEKGVTLTRLKQRRPDSPPIDFDSERQFLTRRALLAQRRARAFVSDRPNQLQLAEKFYEEAAWAGFKIAAAILQTEIPVAARAAFEQGKGGDYHLNIAFHGAAWARLALERGDRDGALRLARASATSIGSLPYETPFSAELAVVLAAIQGDPKGFGQAMAAVAETFGADHPVMAYALTEQSRASLGAGDAETALDAARKATTILIDRADRLGSNQGLDAQAELADGGRAFDAFLRAAYRVAQLDLSRGRTLAGEGFVLAQRMQQTAAGKALSTATGRLGAGEAEQILRERQDTAERWRLHDRDALAAAFDAPERRGGMAAAQREMQALATRRAALDAELRRRFPNLADLARPASVDFPDLQRILSGNEAVLLFHVGEDESHVWAASRDDVRWREISLGQTALGKAVASLRQGLEHAGRDPRPFNLEQSYDLYKALVGDLEALIGNKRLLVVPAGALQSLPFHVLVTSPPDECDGADCREVYRRTAWLVRRQSVLTLPSIGSLLTRSLAPSPAPTPFLGFGDPLLEGSPSGRRDARPESGLRGIADASQVRSMARLPDTADELRALARSAGADAGRALFLGADATEARVKALSASGDLGRSRILAFATHGLVADRRNGMAEAALVMTPPAVGTEADDGLLTTSEIAELRIAADWVVLSACNTASGDQQGAESLSGLARAFLYAGARSLLVSHWPVASDAAVSLTTRTFAALQAKPDLSHAEALREAMLALIDTGSLDDAEPWRWAPFVVVGGGT